VALLVVVVVVAVVVVGVVVVEEAAEEVGEAVASELKTETHIIIRTDIIK
jgi:nitrogen regulatory protein PII-like uncharacterized protein